MCSRICIHILFCLFFIHYLEGNQHIFPTDSFDKTSFITYKLSGGRLGDSLLAYIKAKWISHKYGIPLWYRPFAYSDKLRLHDVDQQEIKQHVKKLRKVHINSESKNSIKPMAHLLYECDKDFKSIGWNNVTPITDESFLNILRSDICPKEQLDNEIIFPSNCITVAVHVRKGGGFDLPLLSKVHNDNRTKKKLKRKKIQYADVAWPLKFPPDSYYIEQIKNVFELCGRRPLYVYIFTDDPYPSKIVEKYKAMINEENIIFDCKVGDNNYSSSILEDLFAMSKFYCLIRPRSYFSMIAQIIGKHNIVILPKHAKWQGKNLIVDETYVITYDHSSSEPIINVIS